MTHNEDMLNTALWQASCAAWEALERADNANRSAAAANAMALDAAQRAAGPALVGVIQEKILLAAYARAVGTEAVAMVRKNGKPPMPGDDA